VSRMDISGPDDAFQGISRVAMSSPKKNRPSDAPRAEILGHSSPIPTLSCDRDSKE